MEKKEILQYWLKSADEDFEVMQSLFEKRHYTWALFTGHLVLEKLLKAYYSQRIGNNAPYIHDLNKIADLGGLELTEEQKDFLDEVTTFNIKARYPDYKERFKKKADHKFTDMHIERIKEFRAWLLSLIKHP